MRRFFLTVSLLLSKVYERLTGNCVVLPTRTRWGRLMWVTLPEPSSTEIFLNGCTDPPLTDFLERFVQKGQTFVDLGAHLGYFSLLAHHLVGHTGRVIAFEPTPSSFGVLRRNITRTNIEAFSYAAWRERAILDFNLYGHRFSAYNSFFEPRVAAQYRDKLKPRTIQVPAISLDEFIVERRVHPQIIKIDAESSELCILQGAQQSLRMYRPVLIVEVGDLAIKGAAGSAQIVAYLRDQLGYAPFEWKEHALRPHREIYEHYQAGNLIFIPAESDLCDDYTQA